VTPQSKVTTLADLRRALAAVERVLGENNEEQP